MKTYILNGPSANERRDFQLLQAEKLGLDAVLINAVTPRDIPAAQFQQQAFMWERPLKITEVACFLSHYGVWEIIALGNEPALVLEDDAMLAQNTPQLLKFLEEINHVEYVCLETRLRKKMIGNKSIACTDAHGSIHPLIQDRTGSAAYVLWPSAAKSLLIKFQQNGMGPSDAFITSSYQLQSWQTVPAFAIQADVAATYGVICPIAPNSLIAHEKVPSPPTRSAAHDLQFKWRRLRSQLRLAGRFLNYFWRARRKYVTIDIAQF